MELDGMGMYYAEHQRKYYIDMFGDRFHWGVEQIDLGVNAWMTYERAWGRKEWDDRVKWREKTEVDCRTVWTHCIPVYKSIIIIIIIIIYYY